MTFVQFLIARFKERLHDPLNPLPIEAKEGRYYSTLTGSDPPTVEIDWVKLQSDIEQLEAEFIESKGSAA